MTKHGTQPGRSQRPSPALDEVQPFVGASDDEIRDAYRERCELITNLVNLVWDRLQRVPVGSDDWTLFSKKIDEAWSAITMWTGPRRARMLLVGAIHDAVLHEEREEQVQRLSVRADAVDEALLKEIKLALPTWRDARLFREIGGDVADTPLFAMYLFRRRCPEFARALLSSGAVAALGETILRWKNVGRPKGGSRAGSKWHAADVLMKAAGLYGTTAESLESDWRAWRSER